MKPNLLRSLELFLDYSSRQEIWDKATAVFSNYGVSAITIAEVFDEDYHEPVFDTNIGCEFISAYTQSKTIITDPWMSYCAYRNDPWLLDVKFELERNCSSRLGVAKLFNDFGFRNVLLVPTRHSRVTRGLVLYSSETDPLHLDVNSENGKKLKLVASVFADVYSISRSIGQADYDFRQGLSPREIESLKWLASGLRTERIAHKMGVRPVTISKNFESIRLKLGASTREAALFCAVRKGLLEI